LRLRLLLYPTEEAMTREPVELIHDGRYAAEVPVEHRLVAISFSGRCEKSWTLSGWHCVKVKSPKPQSMDAYLTPISA
jgi:hypothetical protein